jgi:hypothetical protein
MPQKPQDRAKEKRRLTRRLAKWRASKESPQQPKGVSAPSATAAEKKAS